MGLNKFSDLTHEEFGSQHLGVMPAGRGDQLRKDANFMFDDFVVETSVDWRTKGAISGVEDQGTCVKQWGEKLAMALRRKLLGVFSNWCYPTCDVSLCRKRNSTVVPIDDYQDVPTLSERSPLQAVTKQPVSIAIEARGRDFQHYQGGVFTGTCGTKLDHGVLAVGYDTDQDSQPYWLIKNSWGSNWGEKGCMRLARSGSSDPDGKCGINIIASFPVKKAAGPPPPPAPAAKNAFTQCDNAGHSCSASSRCCCAVSAGEYSVQWGCCPVGPAICCGNSHCCPAEFPVCDLRGGRYLMSSNPFGVPMLKRTRAEFILPNSFRFQVDTRSFRLS